ncbi:MAG: hypothetical protein JKY50_08200 [Oleispira sp.]|nr:hypothetical protein [Oleispira sp.]MBL4881003.1 hypothetical protein [Oleispira sp.]
MKRIKTSYVKRIVLSTILSCSLGSIAYAESPTALQGVKLGFGADMGLGITAQMGKFNGFFGNDGIAVDYIVVKKKLGKKPSATPVHWYAGAGGFGEWKGGAGVRAPVGIEISFAERLDAYVQVIPEFKIIDGAKFGLGGGLGVRYQF